jgi:DNA-binding beta-propeller fold protein YncE
MGRKVVGPLNIRKKTVRPSEEIMKSHGTLGTILIATLLLAGCGGGGGGSILHTLALKAFIAVPGVGTTTNYSFDISAVDPVKGRYYFTDRNNKSVDVFDITTNTFIKQISGGFAGCNAGPPAVPAPTCAGANNDLSGPDGLNIIPGTTFIYVGDVNSVKIIDTQTDTVVKTIVIGGTSGFRADEGCYDPDHKIFMINSPGESPPFATFIDTVSQKIIATVLFTDPGTGPAGPASAGLEACVYDHATASFLNNNDGSTANPHGEVDVIPASFVLQGTPAAPVRLTLPVPTAGNGFKIFPLGNCDPTGIDLGPGTDFGVMCRQGTTGALLTFQILDRTNGTVRAVVNAGGGDQIAYDAATNRYYLADSRYTATGLAAVGGACSSASPCTPLLIVVDATTYKIVASAVTGNNAHSIAVDSVNHQVYMPLSSAAAPGGCATCAATFPSGGVGVYSTD